MTIGRLGYNPYPVNQYAYGNSFGPAATGTSNAKDAASTPGAASLSNTQKANRECQTCKERKYQDGSDEMVSFKSAAHISPEDSATRVRAHEQEHVSNAYNKAAEKGGKVVFASVALHTAICPECGRSYVSGGVTNTQIKYSNEENPYQKNKKAADAGALSGMNADYSI